MRVAACYDLGQKVLDPDVRRLFARALDDMRAAGATVEEVGIQLPDTMLFFDHLNACEYLEFAQEMQAGGVELWLMVLEPAERAKSVTGRQVSAAFRQGKTDIYNAFLTAMTGADVLVTPTTPVTAFPRLHRGSDRAERLGRLRVSGPCRQGVRDPVVRRRRGPVHDRAPAWGSSLLSEGGSMPVW
ncbi:hypothetical protein GCM10011579_082900 [Streptomyces albiflavescens]|uniref:Amidase n=1 Tax=Streptomyces albiflavescens TaxID=1623582 RepID=A0A917YDG0_9ACTN|nr:amidase family protein [Streptomyces albiflavescens]GGN88823.1 hypothetical protein GCM10011579_082900 [Streptomyces albiflavescens]